MTNNKKVHFNLNHKIFSTYSSCEYNRGSALICPVPDTDHPGLKEPIHLLLSMNTGDDRHSFRQYDINDEDGTDSGGDNTYSPVWTNGSNASADHHVILPITLSNVNNDMASPKPCQPLPIKSNRQRLKIDTSICTGPSVFTVMSTFTYPRLNAGEQDNKDTVSDYSVRISAVPV